MSQTLVHIPISSRALGIVGEALQLARVNNRNLLFLCNGKDTNHTRQAVEAALKSYRISVDEDTILTHAGSACTSILKVTRENNWSLAVASLPDLLDSFPFAQLSPLQRMAENLSCPLLLFNKPNNRGSRFRAISLLIDLSDRSIHLVEAAAKFYREHRSSLMQFIILSPPMDSDNHESWHRAQVYATDQFLSGFNLEDIYVKQDYHNKDLPVESSILERRNSDLLIISNKHFDLVSDILSRCVLPVMILPGRASLTPGEDM